MSACSLTPVPPFRPLETKAPDPRRLRGDRSASRMLAIALVMLSVAWGTGASAAEGYSLDAGDRIRVSVIGEPEYPLEITVDDRGAITLPLLGEVTARGRPASDLARAIQVALQQADLMRNPFVQVDVLEFRPFFISGAVGSPGSYPFRPGITVRHALAIAGGFKPPAVGDTAPALRIADLRGERAGLLIEEFRLRVRLERLNAEVRGQDEFVAPADAPADMSPTLIRDVVASERDQMEMWRRSIASQLSYLETSLSRAQADLERQGRVREERENAASFQLKQLETARTLHEKGLVTNTNLLTAERTQNSYRVDVAEAEVDEARVRQEILNLENELRKKQEERRLDIIGQIQDTQLALGKVQSNLRYVSDKLLFVSSYGEHRSFDELQGAIRVVVHRGTKDGSQVIEGNESTSVEAGDVIEISVVAREEFFDPGTAVGSPAPTHF